MFDTRDFKIGNNIKTVMIDTIVDVSKRKLTRLYVDDISISTQH